MTRLEKLKRNPRLLFWIQACAWFNVLNAVVALFFLYRGVGVDEIFYLPVVFSIGTLLFEVPSGYAADRIGRKTVIMIGLLAQIVAFVIFFGAHGFIDFAIATFLMALSTACFSGTSEALLYDSLAETGDQASVTHHASRIGAARHMGKVFVPAVAALFVNSFVEWRFDLLIAVNVAVVTIALIITLFLVEPHHKRSLTKSESMRYLDTFKTIRTHPFLLRAAMNSSLVFIASYIAFRAYQPFLNSVGVSIVMLAVFYMGIHGISFWAKWHMGKILERIPLIQLLHATSVLLVATGVLASIFHEPAIAFGSILLFIILTNIREPLFTEAMNRRIKSHQRATTLSNLYVLKAFIDIPVFLLVGWLALKDLQYPFWVALALVAIVAVLFPIRESDLR